MQGTLVDTSASMNHIVSAVPPSFRQDGPPPGAPSVWPSFTSQNDIECSPNPSSAWVDQKFDKFSRNPSARNPVTQFFQRLNNKACMPNQAGVQRGYMGSQTTHTTKSSPGYAQEHTQDYHNVNRHQRAGGGKFRNFTDNNVRPDLVKTRLCRRFLKMGYCERGETCWFAHGEAELPQRLQNQKLPVDVPTEYQPGKYFLLNRAFTVTYVDVKCRCTSRCLTRCQW